MNNTPTEFVSLHENDSFSTEMEKDDSFVSEIPVIREPAEAEPLETIEDIEETQDDYQEESYDDILDTDTLNEMLSEAIMNYKSSLNKTYNRRAKKIKLRI